MVLTIVMNGNDFQWLVICLHLCVLFPCADQQCGMQTLLPDTPVQSPHNSSRFWLATWMLMPLVDLPAVEWPLVLLCWHHIRFPDVIECQKLIAADRSLMLLNAACSVGPHANSTSPSVKRLSCSLTWERFRMNLAR